MAEIQVASNDRFFGIKDHGAPRKPSRGKPVERAGSPLVSRGAGKGSALGAAVYNTIIVPFVAVDRGFLMLHQIIENKSKKAHAPAKSPKPSTMPRPFRGKTEI